METVSLPSFVMNTPDTGAAGVCAATGALQTASSAIARITGEYIVLALDWVDLQVCLDPILHRSTSSGNLRARHSFAPAPEGLCSSRGVVVEMNAVGNIRLCQKNDLPGVHREMLDDMINLGENSVVALLHRARSH